MARVLPVLLIVLAIAASTPAAGEQWMANGGFESGTGNALISEGSPADCEPHSGDAAFGVTAVDPQIGRVTVQIPGPLPQASFTLSGWTRIQSGAGSVSVGLVFFNSAGMPTGPANPAGIPSGSQYTAFSITRDLNFAPESAQVTFNVQTINTVELCIDSLQLTTPDPTPSPTSTATDTPVPDPTATAAPTATSTATPVPTATTSATPAPSTTSTATSTPTNTPTATPTTPAGPSFVFTNGDFEAGLEGWSKYGGTLTTTSNALSGSIAGLLTSATDSTKWAYQAVHVEAGAHYEFSGYVQPDAGASEALLRISWYPTTDASGPSLSTSDSVTSAPGGSGTFVFLTTGLVQAPPGAGSARVRVLLAPLSASPASVRIDDVSFFATAAPTPTHAPTSSPSPASTTTASPTPTVSELAASATFALTPDASPEPASNIASRALAASAGEVASTPTAPPSAESPVAEVAAARSEARAVAAATLPPSVATAPPPEDPSPAVSWPWLVGIALLIGGLGGAYLQNKHTAR